MPNETAVEARAVTKRFGQGQSAMTALDDVSVEIRRGDRKSVV